MTSLLVLLSYQIKLKISKSKKVKKFLSQIYIINQNIVGENLGKIILVQDHNCPTSFYRKLHISLTKSAISPTVIAHKIKKHPHCTHPKLHNRDLNQDTVFSSLKPTEVNKAIVTFHHSSPFKSQMLLKKISCL